MGSKQSTSKPPQPQYQPQPTKGTVTDRLVWKESDQQPPTWYRTYKKPPIEYIRDHVIGQRNTNYPDAKTYLLDYIKTGLPKNTQYGRDLHDTDVPIYLLPTYQMFPMFLRVADIYDNALATIFLISIENEQSHTFVSSLLYCMCMEGYDPTQLTRDLRLVHFVGLHPRYWTELSDTSKPGRRSIGQYPYFPFSRDNFTDTGNTAWVLIALGKYILKYGKLFGATLLDVLIRTLLDQWSFLTVHLWVSPGMEFTNSADKAAYGGFMGRLTLYGTYLSIEHQLDMAACIKIILRIQETWSTSQAFQQYAANDNDKYNLSQHGPSGTTLNAVLRAQLSQIDVTMKALFNDDAKCYYTGTGLRATEINTISPIPTDAQSWSFLAGVNGDPAGTLDWACKHCVKSNDWSNVKFVGTAFSQVLSEATNAFTENTVIQWENSGSLFMALVKLLGTCTSFAAFEAFTKAGDLDRILSSSIYIGRSIVNLISVLRDTNGAALGIPAAFEGEGTLQRNSGDNSVCPPGGQSCGNTGFSWSYYAYPHLASTVWCCMSILYLEATEDARESFNPYSDTVSPATSLKDFDVNQTFGWFQRSPFSPVTCVLSKLDASKFNPKCTLTANHIEHLNYYCGVFTSTGPLTKITASDLEKEILDDLQRNGGRQDICSNPRFIVCDDLQLQAKSAGYIYEKLSGATCGESDDCLAAGVSKSDYCKTRLCAGAAASLLTGNFLGAVFNGGYCIDALARG